MKNIYAVSWTPLYDCVFIDVLNDESGDFQNFLNIAQVFLFDRVVWLYPEYKDNPQVQGAITEAKKWLSENTTPKVDDNISLEQFMDDVSKLVDFWEDTEKEDFKQNVAAEVGRFVDDENELVEISNQYPHLANHNYMSVLRVQQFLKKNK